MAVGAVSEEVGRPDDNDVSARRASPRAGGRSALARATPSARIRRRWRALAGVLVAAQLVTALLAALGAGPAASLGALGLAPLLFGLAWLAFERWVAPELLAIESARSELDARHAAALHAAGETSEYLRDVSHEIRATMHAVLGQTQLLSRSPLDASQHRQLRTIDGAARALLRMINDLMALSGSGRRSFEVVPLGGSLHDVLRVSADLLEPAAKNRGLELELHIGLELPDQVLIDTGRAQQLVLGACRHAIEVNTQGRLRIDARALAPSASGFELSLRVELDDPSAAPAAGPRGEAPRLLRELLAAMGGSLSFGEAGVLELRLPVQRIDGGDAERQRRPSQPGARPLIRLPAPGAPILVVDSDEAACLAAVELLENLGFEVEAASSAPLAIERVAQKKYALILLDTELAGLDGYMAAARILTQLGQGRPPIIGTSRAPLGAARERAAAAGMDALLAKPLGRDALCAALAEWLPDDGNPASSGTRLSQAGALAQATQRGREAKLSAPPRGPLDPSPERLAGSAAERFARDVPAAYRALARAVARGRRDDVATLARALAEYCASCAAPRLAALAGELQRARELSVEQLGTALQALGRGLDAALRQLGHSLDAPDSPPASATNERPPDGL